MKIKLSKSQWEEMGKKAGWIRTAEKYLVVDNDFNRANYPNLVGKTFDSPPSYAQVKVIKDVEEKAGLTATAQTEDEQKDIDGMNDQRGPTFSFGQTPEQLIKDIAPPEGYRMHIKSQAEWAAIAKAVNQGIDSHLEGFTRSTFDSKTGQCLIHPAEMTTFLRRLYEAGDDESWGLRSAILDTLGVEEV